MPLVTKAVETVGNRLPKVISPKAHAIIDYATIGSFILMGALFWKRNKRAAISALVCAAVDATTVLLTGFPGGVSDVLSFETHGRVDAGLSGAVASLPNILGFGSEPEAKYFRIQGSAIAGVTALTDFKAEERYESEYDVA